MSVSTFNCLPQHKRAADYVKQLLVKYDLLNYSFKYNRQKRTLGYCYYPGCCRAGRIELSYYLVLYNDWKHVRETILHEIAHALAHKRYGEAGHGQRWKEVCVELGIAPERCCSSASVYMPKPVTHTLYEAICPTCSKRYTRKRAMRKSYIKAGKYKYCPRCGPYKGELSYKKVK
jgi:predicted SprT family Zn-dependent metalloprotease